VRKLSVLVGLLALIAVASFAQTTTAVQTVGLTVNTIATVRLSGTGAISLAIGGPAIAGNPPADVASDGSTYLQYTVVSGVAYQISVTASGAVPGGTVLSVTALAPEGAIGIGTIGTPVGAVTLRDPMPATALITNIKNVWTGVGATSGAKLTYNFGIGGTFGDEIPGTTSLVVTYTIATP
jgi:hypothetical protein